MSANHTAQVGNRHLERLENLPLTQAKADLTKHELGENAKEMVGKAVGRCFALAGLSQKEAAALVGREAAQISRWISGAERPQLDVLFVHPCLRQPLVQALAELAGDGVDVQTVVTMRRRSA
jgi:hypothetical protein